MPENYLNDVKYKQIGNCSGIVKQTMISLIAQAESAIRKSSTTNSSEGRLYVKGSFSPV